MEGRGISKVCKMGLTCMVVGRNSAPLKHPTILHSLLCRVAKVAQDFIHQQDPKALGRSRK